MSGKFAKVGVCSPSRAATLLHQQAGVSSEPGHLLRIKVREGHGLATLCLASQEESCQFTLI